MADENLKLSSNFDDTQFQEAVGKAREGVENLKDKLPAVATPEQPPMGGFCETCGHFAGRHTENGCNFPRPNAADCDCPGMEWNGLTWPRPWLAAPEGLTKES